jgi:hypothetical protein
VTRLSRAANSLRKMRCGRRILIFKLNERVGAFK